MDGNKCEFGLCSQQCTIKKYTNHTCSCVEGYYHVIKDGIDMCQPNSQEPLFFLSSNGPSIEMLHIPEQTNQMHDRGDVNLYLHKINSVDYFFNYLHSPYVSLFVIDSKMNTIVRKDFTVNIDRAVRSTNPRDTEIIFTSPKPISVKVDWITEKLFVLDKNLSQIIVMTLDGKHLKTVLNSHPYAITMELSPTTGHVLWSTYRGGIFIADMSGENEKRLISSHFELIVALAMDHAAKRLYWIDKRKKTIETIELNGANRVLLHEFNGNYYPLIISVRL